LSEAIIEGVKKILSKIGIPQKILSNISWLFFDTLIRYAVGLFVSVWVARYLGPDDFGIFSYALAFIGLFGVIGSLGLRDIAIREIVKDQEETNKILGTSFVMMLIGNVFALCIALVVLNYIRPEDSTTFYLVLFIGSAFLLKPFGTIAFYFDSIVKSKYIVYANQFSYFSTSAFKIGLILLSANLLYFGLTPLFQTALMTIGLLVVYSKYGLSIREWKFDSKTAKALLKDSLPIFLSGFMIMVYVKIDQIMIRDLTTDREAGIYAVAVRLTELWYFIPGIIYTSTFPGIVGTKDPEIFYKKLQKLYNGLVLVSYAISIPVCLTSGFVVRILYGSEYVESGPLLAILIWVLVFVSIGIGRNAFLFSKNWTKFYFIITTISAFFNIGLNYFLIPQYGAMGAVIATLISYAFAGYLSCYLYRPLFKTGNMLTKAIFFPKVR